MASIDIGLDNPVFAGRLRSFDRKPAYQPRPTAQVRPRGISDVFAEPVAKTSAAQSAPVSQAPHQTAPVHTARSAAAVPVLPRRSKSHVLQRRATSKPALHVTKSTRSINSPLLFKSLAVALVLVGVGVSYWGWRTNQRVAAQVQGASTQQGSESDVPSEDKPSDEAYRAYHVSPDMPRYVRIKKLGVDAMVRRMTINNKGALQAPSNIHTAGWYDGSSKPGEGGAVLLDGHVAGPTQRGVFYDLKRLSTNDQIEVERGDGKIFTYKVVKTQKFSVNNVDMASAMLPVVEGKPGLNLITCTGKVSGMHYDERLIVYAVQI